MGERDDVAPWIGGLVEAPMQLVVHLVEGAGHGLRPGVQTGGPFADLVVLCYLGRMLTSARGAC